MLRFTTLLLFIVLFASPIYAQLIDFPLALDQKAVCSLNPIGVYTENAQVGVDYYLLDANGNLILPSVAGTGDGIKLPLDSSNAPYYTVRAVGKGAAIQLLNAVTLTANNRTIDQFLSIGVRVKIDSGSSSFSAPHISKQGTYRLDFDPNGTVEISSASSIPSNSSGSSTTNLNDNQWHYIVGTIDLLNGIWSIYVDGVLENSDTTSSGGTFSTFSPLSISPASNFQLDDLTFWNKSLSLVEIQTYRNTCLTGNEPGLVGYFNFNEGTGYQVQDKSPIGLNGLGYNLSPINWREHQDLNCAIDTLHFSDTIFIPNLSIPLDSIWSLDSITCQGDSTTVLTDGSILGASYLLINHTTNQVIDGPQEGTSTGLSFNTHAIYSSSTYRIIAKKHYKNTLYFNGINSSIATDLLYRNITGRDLTIATWVKMDVTNSTQPLFKSQGISLFVDPYGKAHMQGVGDFPSSSGPVQLSASSISRVDDNQWHYIVGIIEPINSQGNIKIYIDGVLEGTYSITSPGILVNDIGAESTIGADFNSSYQGFMADFALFKAHLSPTEIQYNQTNCLQGNEPNLMYYFTFDAIAGNTIIDRSSITNGHASNINMSTDWLYSSAPSCPIECNTNASSNTIAVNVLPVSIFSDTIASCSGIDHTFPDGTTFYNITTDTLHTSIFTSFTNGCDSIIYTSIDIEPNIQIILNGLSLSVNQANANYQWLDCTNNFTIIPGAINQSFTPSTNGNYAVEVNMNGCLDTSACTNVIVNSIQKRPVESIQIYPNPAQDILYLETSANIESLRIFSSNGALLQSNFNKNPRQLSIAELPQGLYFLEIKTTQGILQHRFVKQ